MSDEQDTSSDEAGQAVEGGNDESGFTPPATQDELNRIIERRLERERSKYAGFEDLRAKAARLDELEQASKTEQEKLSERLAAAEEAATKATTEALRFKIASKFQVTDEDAEMFLTGTDEGTLTKQAQRLAARDAEAGKPRPPRPDANQGRQSGGSASTADQFAAVVGELF